MRTGLCLVPYNILVRRLDPVIKIMEPGDRCLQILCARLEIMWVGTCVGMEDIKGLVVHFQGPVTLRLEARS